MTAHSLTGPQPAARRADAPLLQLSNVCMRFGGLRAVDQVSFTVNEGEIVGLIGPNGAGKTTVINCISRVYLPTAGTISFGGRDLREVAPHQVVGLGLSRTFQNIELFKSLSALENVLVGTHHRCQTGIFTHMLRLPAGRKAERALRAEALDALNLVGCSAWAQVNVASLPLGVQKRVEMARAIVAHPRLVLLDEPAGGLNSGERQELSGLVAKLRQQLGLSVLIIEHHMDLVMALCDRLIVLDFGKKIAEGAPDVVRKDPVVIEAYLGTQEDQGADHIEAYLGTQEDQGADHTETEEHAGSS